MTIEPEPTSHPVPSRRSSTRRLLGELPRPDFRAGAVVVLVIAALVVAILVSLFTSSGAVRTIGVELSADASAVPAATPGSTAPAGSAAGELFIHVLGAVAAPGVYRLPDGSRAFDAVASAGGLLPEADTSAVNLARFVNDGEQLYVPVLGEVPPGGGASGSAAESPSGSQLVNVNTASAAELTALPRIGEALAARIVAWREANGPFATLDDLSAVEGIGAKTLEGLRAAATV
ncbi:ComEA family DNA-binding protein [Plantibacter flavus]|uniref:ComEA family DNA-binding protein n=1 Tax=Plantibacter flavus TaxID=150123 RepID=UPI0033965DEB